MICKKIDIPIFEYKLRSVEIESKKDVKAFKAHMKWAHLKKEHRQDLIQEIEDEVYDGGQVFCNHMKRKILLILHRPSSDRVRINVLAHEKRHVEDRIMAALSIDDAETAAFLAGYLAEKLM